MYKITLGDAIPMIGSFGIHLDYTVRLKFRLRDKIDCEILEEGLNGRTTAFDDPDCDGSPCL